MGDPHRDLIHKVNNLLSVIYTQVEVGRASSSHQEALEAMEHIQRAAESTVPYVRRAAANHEAGT
jgi:hypothetical protein